MTVAIEPPENRPLAARVGLRLWVASFLAMLVVAAAGYGLTGRPETLWGPPTLSAHGQEGEPSPQQIQEMVDRLAQRLQQNPDDAAGWSMLARSYLALGRLDEAVGASERALQMRPQDAQALVDHADVLAMRNGRSLNGEPTRLIQRALQIDPNNVKGLALAGAAAFDQGRMEEAARLWDRVAELGPPDSPLVQQAREGAQEARRQATPPSSDRLDAKAPVQAGSSAASASAAVAAPAASNSVVAGRVTIAAALAGRVAPDDTVFVFARAADGAGAGPRMPLAALKARGKDLPLSFTLDDRHAMAPGSLSSAKKVVLLVRVSRTGQPTPQAGDLEGQSDVVDLGRRDLTIEISRVIP